MNLQGRDLKQDLKGDDVRLLHDAMAQLGLAVTATDRRTGTFGCSTESSIKLFQRQEGLEPTGVVDDVTARA